MMLSGSTRLKSARRGAITVLVPVCLIAIVGVAAIALDGGLMQDNKRRVQGAADAAALAAATELFRNYSAITTSTPDPGSKGQTAALAYASQNGFANDGSASTVVVNTLSCGGAPCHEGKFLHASFDDSGLQTVGSVWRLGL